MIVALKPGVTKENRAQLMDWLQNLGLHIHVSEGEYQTILGLVGDTSKVDMDLVASLDIVDSFLNFFHAVMMLPACTVLTFSKMIS